VKTNVIVQGLPGSGKTQSILTLLPEYADTDGVVRKGAGLETFVISMEPGHQAIFGPHGCKQGLHVHYHFPTNVTWDTISSFVRILQNDSVADAISRTDPKKSSYTGFMELFAICKNFTCDACGEEFGDASEWAPERAIVMDSLSPLCTMVMQCVVGGKPVPSKPEYFAAIGFLLSFLRLFFGQTKCSAIATAHMDREVDPITGSIGTTLDVIGQRAAPHIRKMPDELVTAYCEDGRYYWSNEPSMASGITKRRALPLSSTLAPDFSQIFKGAST
jgi:hypothetical protein